ncbi:MAG TPA: ABC transporter substrate binding protein [Xanthobacteraceae bacterium]|jgi:putative tryptophan/tyrosine transport system substrate-binding protein|nr:ABC transporter substrate binding protein [Xanthobacteraceae bacterium]
MTGRAAPRSGLSRALVAGLLACAILGAARAEDDAIRPTHWPVASKPVGAKPVVAKPVAPKPASVKTVAAKAVATKNVGAKTVAAKTVAASHKPPIAGAKGVRVGDKAVGSGDKAAAADKTGSTEAKPEEKPFSSWFRYRAELDQTWAVTADPADSMRLSIRRKSPVQSGSLRRVLVLYPRPSSAYDIAISSILRVFDDKEQNVEFTVINFDLKDWRGRQVIDFAEAKSFDLIFAMGSESTAWMHEHYRGGAIPVVSVCSKDPVELGQMKDYDHGSGTNFAFTSLNVPVDVQMAYVKELKPDLANIAVLVDSKNVSAVQTQAEPIAKYARLHGIGVVTVAVQDPKAAREELARLIPDAVRTMRRTDPNLTRSLFWLTGSTSVFKEIHTINENVGRVPVVSVVPEIVTEGADTAVLGIGISFESNAHLAAVYADQILRRVVKPGDLKVGIVSPPDISISFLKAHEIGMRIPFSFFESASFIYDYQGRAVRRVAHEGAVN